MTNATVDNKPHSVDELSALFDEIEVGSNLDAGKSPDYGAASTEETVRPFADKVADVKAVLEPEPDSEIPAPEEVENPVAPQPLAEVEEPKPSPAPAKVEDPAPAPTKAERIQEAVENGDYMRAEDTRDEGNPLGLSGQNLRAYRIIKEKYPQFQLWDGSQGYKEFYRYKVQQLKNLLARYGILPISDMKQEIENIRLDKRLGDDLADPVVIGQRMDESIANRGRVAALLAKAESQLAAWKKTFEWLNSKVWKDHDLKGAHKRDSLALEHNADMKDYYCELQGFVDAATTIDSFLKSQHDSYSRQLSCVDMREKVGVAHKTVSSEIEHISKPEPVSTPSPSPAADSELDGLDTLDSGTVIDKVPKGGLVIRDFPGEESGSEFLDGIG